jgi:GTPase SAR1 family protein
MAVFIPDRIRKELNYFIDDHFFSGGEPKDDLPLIFCLVGPAGVGKTLILKQVLHERRIKVLPAAVWSMGGRFEGDSLKSIFDLYIEASNHITSTKNATVLKMEDLHLSPLASTAGQSSTVNSNMLRSFVMELCEDPWNVRMPSSQQSPAHREIGRAEYVKCERVPIFSTSNSLADMHPPIIRSGRMEVVVYNPDETELIQTISAITNLSIQDSAYLRTNFPNESPAFFGDLQRRYQRLRRDMEKAYHPRVGPHMPLDAKWWDLMQDAGNFLVRQRSELNFLNGSKL